MVKLTISLVMGIAIRVMMYAILLFILLLILRTISLSRKSKKRVFPILTKLKIRTIIIALVGSSIITSVLILGILSISANKEITLLIKNLKNCEALGVENSLMFVKEDPLENSIVQDRKKIQDLIRVLSEVEYKRSIYRGPIETRDMVNIHIVGNNRKKPHSFCIIGNLFIIGNFPNLNEYETSDYILRKARKALGIRNRVVLKVTDPNKQKFEIPIGERKVWIGTKKAWESRHKKDN